jgi:hypothetical protein
MIPGFDLVLSVTANLGKVGWLEYSYYAYLAQNMRTYAAIEATFIIPI